MPTEAVDERVGDAHIRGSVASGFEGVLDAFVENFERNHEIGAACAAYRGDEVLFDLWGGFRDPKTSSEWQADTLVCPHSSTKAIAATAMAMSLSRGHLELDAPVATYWPEFAAKGKGAITVRQVLDHSAGIPVVDEPITVDDLADLDALAAKLERQAPVWEPGTRHGYHGWTLGMLQNELMRRTDPQGRTIGQFVQEEICGPLGVEFYIGLPDEIPNDRITDEIVNLRSTWEMVAESPFVALSFFVPVLGRKSLAARMLNNPAALGKVDNFATRPVRRVEIPAGGGIGTARAMARTMGVCASGGEALGLTRDVVAELERPYDSTRGTKDAVMRIDSAFQMGFSKPVSNSAFVDRPTAYFAPGGGGSMCLADPETGVGFGYAVNRFGASFGKSPRVSGLGAALFGALEP